MIPLALCAMGEVLAERAGVVNIGLEGILLISAFTATVGAHFAQSAWIGILVGILTGFLIGALHGWISIYLKGDQIISGVGINLLAIGFVAFGIIAVWNTFGAFSLNEAYTLKGQNWNSGWNIVLPESGPNKPAQFLGKISIFLPFMFIMAGVMWWILHKTAFGLRVKAVGENPEAADVAGVRVERTQMIAVLVGAALGGLAGAYLSVDWNGLVTRDIAAGRGFISLATVVFSKLNPLLTLVGAFVFGLFDNLGLWLSTFSDFPVNIFGWEFEVQISNYFYFIRMLPYVVTLFVVAGVIGRARFPKAIGVPYRRE